MDNITHALVSLSTAEASIHLRRTKGIETTHEMGRLLWITAFIAGMLPDIDVLFSAFTGGRLGYLVHRRGLTHGVLGLVVELCLILFLLWVFSRLRKKAFHRSEWMWLGGLSAINLCLHVALDGLNSYGVRWLWPFTSQWFYGDALFIMEPWLWVCLLPPLFLTEVRPTVRLSLAGLFWLPLVYVGLLTMCPGIWHLW